MRKRELKCCAGMSRDVDVLAFSWGCSWLPLRKPWSQLYAKGEGPVRRKAAVAVAGGVWSHGHHFLVEPQDCPSVSDGMGQTWRFLKLMPTILHKMLLVQPWKILLSHSVLCSEASARHTAHTEVVLNPDDDSHAAHAQGWTCPLPCHALWATFLSDEGATQVVSVAPFGHCLVATAKPFLVGRLCTCLSGVQAQSSPRSRMTQGGPHNTVWLGKSQLLLFPHRRWSQHHTETWVEALRRMALHMLARAPYKLGSCCRWHLEPALMSTHHATPTDMGPAEVLTCLSAHLHVFKNVHNTYFWLFPYHQNTILRNRLKCKTIFWIIFQYRDETQK